MGIWTAHFAVSGDVITGELCMPRLNAKGRGVSLNDSEERNFRVYLILYIPLRKLY
jgi:hypothetical protein